MAMTLSLVLEGSIDPKPKTAPKNVVKKPLSTFVPKFDPLPVVTSSFTKKAEEESEIIRMFQELQGQVKEEDPAFALLVKMEKVYQCLYDHNCPPVTRYYERLTCNGKQYCGHNFQGASPFTSCLFWPIKDKKERIKFKIYVHEGMLGILSNLFQKLPSEVFAPHQKKLIALFNEHVAAVKKWDERLQKLSAIPILKATSRPWDLMGITHAQKKCLSGKGAIVCVNEELSLGEHIELDHIPTRKASVANDDQSRSHAAEVTGIIAANKIGIAPRATVIFIDDRDPHEVEKVKNKGAFINVSRLTTNRFHDLFLPDDDTLDSMSLAEIKWLIQDSYLDPQDYPKVIAILSDDTLTKARKKEALKDFIKLDQCYTHDKMSDLAAGNLLAIAAGNEGVIITENERERGLFFYLQDSAIAESCILVVNVHDDGVTPHRSSNLPGDFGNMALCACGTDVFTTTLKGQYKRELGTSFAAPHVTGVAALIKEAYPMLNTQEIRACLLEGAKPIIMREDGKPKLLESSKDLTNYDEVIIKKSRRLFGRGLLNAEGALEQARLKAAEKAQLKAAQVSSHGLFL